MGSPFVLHRRRPSWKLAARLAVVAGLAWQVTPLVQATAAHAATTCSPIASLSGDVAPSGSFSNAANVIATFDHARQTEGCSVPLSIDQSSYDSATPQMQMYMLFNAERRDRGLGTLQLDSTLLTQVDLNHSREMAQYRYFNHPSPINHPGNTSTAVFGRDTVNPAINGHWSYVGENIAAGYPTAAQAVYVYMYQDSGDGWGHRHNILGYMGSGFGLFNWVGIGVASGGPYGIYYSSDFLQGNSTSPYTPPSAADTQAPSLSSPVVISGSSGGTETIQVSNVSDSGASSGEAALTGVTFYVNSVTMDSSGNANTVIGTQVSPGVWQATLSVPTGDTVHAVALDGSGNYTDCAAGAGFCGSGTTPPSPTPSPSPTPTPSPSSSLHLTVTPNSGRRSSYTYVSGSGYRPNEYVILRWNCPVSTCTTTSVATVRTNTSGSFSNVRILVPRYSPLGTVSIGGRGLTSLLFGTTTYTVTG